MSTSKSNATAPVIVSINDSKGEIPQGGKTSDTNVTARGHSESGTKVEVFDGTILKGTVTADTVGNWSLALSGLIVGVHIITASVSGSVSAPRTFSVVP